MCTSIFGGGGGNDNPPPPPPPAPPAPPPAPAPEKPKTQQARRKARDTAAKQALLAKGRSDTIGTSPLGLPGKATTGKKMLLGQ